MARSLEPTIAEVLKHYGFNKNACWDCHGTWVVYHWALEQIAAKAGVQFDPPQPLEADGASKSVAICVTGRLNDKAEWSIGEASPANNKNSYPYAMAEKRAKDRVILKLIGLHGVAYSEEEADAFKPQGAQPPQPASQPEAPKQADQIEVIDANGEVSPFPRTKNGALKAMAFMEGEIDRVQKIEDQAALWRENAATFHRLAEKAGDIKPENGAQTIAERVAAHDKAFKQYMEAA